MSKKSVIISMLVIVVLGAAFYFSANKNPISTPSLAEGKVVIGITDAATAIQGVSSIMITVDKVEVLSAAQGWITIGSGSKQYDLLQLKQTGAVALLADANISAGTYNQIRLTISKVEVISAGKVQVAKLPSGTLKIVGRLVVEEGKTATAVLDFLADKSLHLTGNGKFILAPVVKFQTKSDVLVEVRSDNTLKISGGKDEDEVSFGMDERGESKKDFEFDADVKIELDSDGVIHILGQKREEDKNKEDDDKKGEDKNKGEVKLNLSSQNNSGIAGTVKLDGEDGKVEVKLKLASVPTGVLGLLGISLGSAHPAHIHTGSCASLGAVKYPLTSTITGESETTINASLADLKAQQPLAVNVHKSPEEIGVYVACADIKF